MAAKLCCTVRPFTPDQPPSRAIELSAFNGAVPTDLGEAGSRYASARTEDLQEIQQFFNDANFINNHPSIGDLFPKIRDRISRKSKTKSATVAELLDLAQLQRAKTELRKTLTCGVGPDAGGYDEDAPELEDADTAMTPLDGEASSSCDRGRDRSLNTQMALSFGSNDYHKCCSRLSSSLSPPRRSTETHGLRRSWSDSSLASAVQSRLPQIRLPSLEAATSSRSWRKSVMHSLQISPSIPNFSEADATVPGNLQVKEQALKPDVLERIPVTAFRLSEDVSNTGFSKSAHDPRWAFTLSEKPLTTSVKSAPGLPREPVRAGHRSNSSVHLYNMRISHHLRSPSSISNTPFDSTASTTAAPSAVPTRPQTPDTDFVTPSSPPPQTLVPRKPTPVEVIQTPIQRKPSPLLYDLVLVQRKSIPMSRKPTPIQRAMSQMSQISRNGSVPLPARLARHQRQTTSGSGFSAEDVPEGWGTVVKSDDAASSMYSTALESPVMTPRPSVSHLPRPSVTTIHEHHPVRTAILEISNVNRPLYATTHQSSSSEHATAITNVSMPENPSTSNLSENSKSSKVSRFKEDFDTSMSKKSTKRNSIANLFKRSKAKCRSNNIDSFDGSNDDSPAELKRLQRASRLSEKQDAAGLLAKAIKSHHEEKAALFLDPSKVTPRDKIFRQRSSSFCRARNQSTGSDDVGEGPSIAPIPILRGHRRSASDTYLKPEFSIPGFEDAPLSYDPPAKRSASAERLRPDFSTSIFSLALTPGQPSPSRLKQRMSLALDPMESTPIGSAETGGESRSPSFQLNDLPALLESLPPTPRTCDASRPTTGYVSDSAVADIDDPDLNLGAWSRYPSHTREKRTGSASTSDKVKTRDFAYDVNTLNILEEEESTDDSPQGKKKGKSKKRKKTGLPKSKSMMLGKEYIKNYVRLIRSPSIEWLTHGKGHRSSISAGGSVEHPELEILPPIFAARPILENAEGEANVSPIKSHKGDIELQEIARSGRDHGPSGATNSGQIHCDGSADVNITAAERKRRAASSPDLVSRETAGSRASDARTWSRHYESCVHLPRASQSMERSRHPLNSSEDTNESPIGSEIPLLIDSMLARSRASSMSYCALASTNTFPLRRKSKNRHVSHTSVGSTTSIRASSMDLLKTLAEAEERERMKCLELLTWQRPTVSSRYIP